LARSMGVFQDKLEISVLDNKPHIFANYLLELATAYNAFYRDCHILTSDGLNEFYYALSEKARYMLGIGMEGIGVIPLEEM